VGIRPGRNARFRPLPPSRRWPPLSPTRTTPRPVTGHHLFAPLTLVLSTFKGHLLPILQNINKKEGESHAALHNISCSIGHADAAPLRFYLVIVCFGRERSIYSAKKEAQDTLGCALATAVHAGKCACSPRVSFNSPAFSIVSDLSLSLFNFPSLSCSFL
jgi:hypothetical protein